MQNEFSYRPKLVQDSNVCVFRKNTNTARKSDLLQAETKWVLRTELSSKKRPKQTSNCIHLGCCRGHYAGIRSRGTVFRRGRGRVLSKLSYDSPAQDEANLINNSIERGFVLFVNLPEGLLLLQNVSRCAGHKLACYSKKNVFIIRLRLIWSLQRMFSTR